MGTVVGNIAAGQSKAAFLECLDKIFVMLDEVCDRGLILETNAATLTNRINMAEDAAPDQSFQAAFASAREQMLGSIRRGLGVHRRCYRHLSTYAGSCAAACTA